MSQMGKFINAASIGAVGTLTGNVGGAVSPDGVSNIDIVGSGAITVTGNPAAWTLTITVDDATTAQKGVVELATNAETIAGASATLAVTPASLEAKLGVLTANAVPYGAGTGAAMSWAGPGTDGELLIGATAGAPDFASLTSTDGTISFTTGANSLDLSSVGLDQDQIIYFGKHGNDANDGLTIEKAKLTIGSAITAATALVPGAANRIAIVAFDDGTYTENITLPQYVDLNAPNITISGTIVAADDTCIDIGFLIVATGTVGLTKSAGTSYCNAKINNITCSGNGIGVLATAGFINIAFKQLYVEDGAGIGDLSSALSHIHIQGGDIYITGTGLAVGRANAGTIVGRVDHILDTGAGSGTGIAILSGTIDLNVSLIDNNVAYNVNGAASELRLVANEIIGTRTVAAGGTAKVWVPPTEMTNGELIIGSTGTDPAVASLTSSGSTITFTPGAGTLNLETAGSIAGSFPTDSGTATPAAGALTVAGGDNIDTSGAGSTVTIAVSSAVCDSAAGDAGTATPAAGVLTIAGGTNVTTSAAGSTVTINAAGAGGPEFADNVFRVYDNGDNTKKVAFECSGVTTSTVRTWTVDDRDIDFDAVATSIPTDSGTATPAAGAFTIAGGTNITTSASGSTVTITSSAGGPEFTDDTFRIIDDGDNTKKLAFQASGITTSTTRTWTIDDRNIDFDAVTDSAATDSGTATPAAGVLTIAGGDNIDTSGAGSTVTVAVGSAVCDSAATDSGTATPAAGVLTIAGGDNIDTSGAGSTVTVAVGSAVCDSAATDSGTATPSSGVLTFAGGTNVTTSGAGSTVTINASGGGGGLTWNEVTGTSQAASVDNGYITNNASLVTVTLPDTAALGSVVRICGKGAGGWKLAQNASESIIWDEDTSTTVGTGGSLQSSDDYDAVEVLCTVANTTWTVISSKGNITIV